MSRKTILPNIAYDTQRRSYYVTIRRPAPPGGTPRRTVRCYPTLELAIQALDRKGGEEILANGEDLDKLTLGQWLTYWLEQIIKPSRSASTAHGYTMIIRNHLSPSLGTTQISKLTAAQVQMYLNRMQAKGLCANTVRKHYMLLHNALEHARKQDLVMRNVTEYVTPPTASDPTHHIYDSETLTTVNGRPVNKSTKNRSSIRRLGYAGLLDMEELIERLWNQRQEEMERMGDRYEDNGYVICHDGGRPYQADYLSNRLQRVLSKTELPYVTLHGLRHSFASIANSQNVPLSRALGHSTTSTTSRIYMHLFDDTHLSVVQAVGEAVGGSSSEQSKSSVSE